MHQVSKPTLALLSALMLILGYGSKDYIAQMVNSKTDASQSQSANADDLPDVILKVPAELKLKVGEAKELMADTMGKRVEFQPIDDGLVMIRKNAKTFSVVGVKAGKFQVMAWTAYNNLPSPIQICNVVVEASEPIPPQPAPDKKKDKE